MRILFVHDRFGAMAGAEVNALLTAAELKRRGHQPFLLHGPPTGHGEPAWHDTFPDRHPLNNGDHFAGVRSALETVQPHAVYVHKMAELPVLEALARSGRPIVRMVHDHDLYCLRSYKYSPLTRAICTRPAGWHCVFPCGAVIASNRNGGFPVKWLSYAAKRREIRLNQRFHRMIVATGYMKEELLRNGFDPRRIEIHPPVPRTDTSLAESSFSAQNRIVYSGQIIRGKGVDVLLESLARVRVPFECLILGDGNHRGYCEALSRRLGLADRVRFKGYVPADEVRNHYADASLALVSSVWPEPFGAVGLEAMRHGVPVVAFEAGGIREWLVDGHNGFLVPWMDRAKFAARVEQLLADKSLARKLGAQGRQFAGEKFNFARYISGLETMFERVVNEASAGVAR